MEAEGIKIATNVYAQYGVIGIIIILFVVLFIYVLKTNEKRENRLFTTIDILSNRFEELKDLKAEICLMKNSIEKR